MMKQEDLLKKLREHQTIVVNYGKGILSDNDIKEIAYYDDRIQKYRSNTGIWDTKLLIDIIKGEVENTSIEMESE